MGFWQISESCGAVSETFIVLFSISKKSHKTELVFVRGVKLTEFGCDSLSKTIRITCERQDVDFELDLMGDFAYCTSI